MFVPHWLYLGILLLLAIVVPLVIIRVLRRVFASKSGTAATGGRRGCLDMAGFLLMFLALGLSLAFYFPKTEIRTIEADGALSSRTVILYVPSAFVEAHHLAGFSFDSAYVFNNTAASVELLPLPGRMCDSLSIPAGAVMPVAKTEVSAYNFDIAPQPQQ